MLACHKTNVIYFKGVKIYCPECGDNIAMIRKDLKHQTPMTTACFVWKNQIFETGETANCKKCGALWFECGRFLKTDQGDG
jgi:NMD protein affecting ribosome stability and mRNA decay